MSVLGILGTVHNGKMREEYNYSLEKMGQLIEEFDPDIICGEVRPEDWKKYCEDSKYEGYLGPNEYRKLIIPMCKRMGIQFVPVDWFEDDMTNLDYFRGKPDLEVSELEKQFNTKVKAYMEAAKKCIIPFNSIEFNNIVEEKQDFLNSINTLVHNINWICRNQIMVERIKNVLDANCGKRVLCTVGAEHTYFYCKNLKKNGWEIVYPLA